MLAAASRRLRALPLIAAPSPPAIRGRGPAPWRDSPYSQERADNINGLRSFRLRWATPAGLTM
eukprot:4311930-Prymnesium_polylepis.1